MYIHNACVSVSLNFVVAVTENITGRHCPDLRLSDMRREIILIRVCTKKQLYIVHVLVSTECFHGGGAAAPSQHPQCVGTGVCTVAASHRVHQLQHWTKLCVRRGRQSLPSTSRLQSSNNLSVKYVTAVAHNILYIVHIACN